MSFQSEKERPKSVNFNTNDYIIPIQRLPMDLSASDSFSMPPNNNATVTTDTHPSQPSGTSPSPVASPASITSEGSETGIRGILRNSSGATNYSPNEEAKKTESVKWKDNTDITVQEVSEDQ